MAGACASRKYSSPFHARSRASALKRYLFTSRKAARRPIRLCHPVRHLSRPA
jgi:hypothetical protein